MGGSGRREGLGAPTQTQPFCRTSRQDNATYKAAKFTCVLCFRTGKLIGAMTSVHYFFGSNSLGSRTTNFFHLAAQIKRRQFQLFSQQLSTAETVRSSFSVGRGFLFSTDEKADQRKTDVVLMLIQTRYNKHQARLTRFLKAHGFKPCCFSPAALTRLDLE